MAAGPINNDTLLIIGVVLALLGLGLAFWGRKIWTPFMSFVGAILGGTVGYFIGGYYMPSSYIAALVLALIGSILGSILFNYLVKIALALIVAAIPAVLTYYAIGGNPVADQSAQEPAVIAAILVLLVVFALAYYFVEELIGVVTAAVGAFLIGTGIFLATGATGPARIDVALVVGVIVFFVGAILQTLAIRAAKKGGALFMRKRKAAAAAAYPYPAPATARAPPPPPPPQAAPPPPTYPPSNPPPPPPP